MTPAEWATLALSIGLPTVAGFSFWMFRIDRGLTKLNRLMDDVEKLDTRVDDHGNRIIRLEAKVGHP